jgi:hypothetical protein
MTQSLAATGRPQPLGAATGPQATIKPVSATSARQRSPPDAAPATSA